jgi:hypothetical protein
MDYNTLIASKSTPGSIANWLNSANLVSVAPTIVEEAEAFIYRRLRHFRMHQEVEDYLDPGDDSIEMPANYLEDRIFRLTGIYSQRLTRKTPEEVKDAYNYDGSGNRVPQQPMIYYNSADRLKMDSPADKPYTYELVYYAQPFSLSVTNVTNWLLQFYPRLFRCACMVGAAEFMKDSGVGNYDRTYWEQQAMDEIGTAQAESDRSVRSMQVGAILI